MAKNYYSFDKRKKELAKKKKKEEKKFRKLERKKTQLAENVEKAPVKEDVLILE